MRKNIWLLILLSLLVLVACSDKSSLDGDCDDIIHLSTKSVVLNATADSVKITTGGSWWWLCELTVDGKFVGDLPVAELQEAGFSLNQDFFRFERLDKKTMFIKVEPNETGVDRKIIFTLEAGDYFDRVAITQKGK